MKILTLLLVVVLTACGGGAVEPPLKIIRITSDSTGVGVDGFTVVNHACPVNGCVIVERPWPSYVNVPGYKTVNASVGGMSMREVIDGWPLTSVKPWAQKVTEDSGVELLGLGINDGFALPSAQFADYLRQAVAVGRAAGKLMVLATPNPTFEPRVTALAQVVRDVAVELSVPLVDVDTYVRSIYSGLGFAGDEMHPGQVAYTQIGQYVNQRLQEILQ
jgi:hypothetical protein